tara:strand:- start:99 stop:626 length:528 start_codon:yes stop_codon:yes gene_type:complete
MVGPNINAKNKKYAFSLISKNKLLKMEYIRTPKEIWEILSQEFNFTVDACASDKNHLLPRYWTTETDALKQDWDNEIVYCHPMYDSKIPRFIEKSVNSKCLTVFLLPASTNSVYFHIYLWDNKKHQPKENVQIRFLEKSKGLYGTKFFSEDNEEPKTGYLRPLMIVIIDNRIKYL